MTVAVTDKVTSERISRLVVYIEGLKSRLQGGAISKRHQSRPEILTAWLKLEIKKHESILEKLRMA